MKQENQIITLETARTITQYEPDYWEHKTHTQALDKLVLLQLRYDEKDKTRHKILLRERGYRAFKAATRYDKHHDRVSNSNNTQTRYDTAKSQIQTLNNPHSRIQALEPGNDYEIKSLNRILITLKDLQKRDHHAYTRAAYGHTKFLKKCPQISTTSCMSWYLAAAVFQFCGQPSPIITETEWPEYNEAMNKASKEEFKPLNNLFARIATEEINLFIDNTKSRN